MTSTRTLPRGYALLLSLLLTGLLIGLFFVHEYSSSDQSGGTKTNMLEQGHQNIQQAQDAVNTLGNRQRDEQAQ